ncbi:MAG: hypothetical protein IIU63_02575, partial [Clostridia bacterium]|nr:hypothetical protein [Clostridia bacterium]
KKRLGSWGKAPHNAVLICEANMFFFCGYSVKKERRGFAHLPPQQATNPNTGGRSLIAPTMQNSTLLQYSPLQSPLHLSQSVL